MVPVIDHLIKFLKIFLRCVAVLYIDVIKYKNFMIFILIIYIYDFILII